MFQKRISNPCAMYCKVLVCYKNFQIGSVHWKASEDLSLTYKVSGNLYADNPPNYIEI